MSVSGDIVRELRRERSWSQEQLAAISGLSERTIQRVETDGTCSLDSKMALASAFEVPPTALILKEVLSEASTDLQTDWAGAAGLFLCGLLASLVVVLTATNRLWEISSFGSVIGLTVLLSMMSRGVRTTWIFFDRTSWIVRHPTRAPGLSGLIAHATMVISTAYAVGLFASVVTSLALTIYGTPELRVPSVAFPIVIKPLIYSALFSEFWIRPYKRKLEQMLATQIEQHVNGTAENPMKA